MNLFSADICTIIVPLGPLQECALCVTVSLFVCKIRDGHTECVAWGTGLRICNPLANNCMQWHEAMQTEVLRIPKLLPPIQGVNLKIHTRRNKAVLPDGPPYLMFRFMLYTDSFNQHQSKMDLWFVQGCYIVPLWLDSNTSKMSESARKLSLFASKLNIIQGLSYYIDNVAKGPIEGYNDLAPFGKKVWILLDIFQCWGIPCC